jgi:hypothetical protein
MSEKPCLDLAIGVQPEGSKCLVVTGLNIKTSGLYCILKGRDLIKEGETPMDSEVSDLYMMTQRLEKLERQNRKLMQAGVLALAILFSLVWMGQAPRKPRPIEADRFTLKDSTGKKRAELMMEETGPGLVLYDVSGKRIGRFGAVNTGAGLSLQSVEGGARLSLVSQDEGPYVLMFDSTGKFRTEMGASQRGPYLLFHDTNGSPRAALALDNEQPRLQLSDSEGFTAILGSNPLVTANTQAVQKTNAASLMFFGKEREILWRAP